ncbi:hypothetical protein D3C71_1577270 [compost metagenome]
MAYDMIDGGAQGFGETVITDIGWSGLLHVDNIVMAELIKLIGRNPGPDVRRNHAQNLRSQLSRSS